MIKPIVKLSRPLVLATASPDRRKLVASLGLKFKATVVNIDERPLCDEKQHNYVMRLALAKARAVTKFPKGALVVGVDTAIGVDDAIIGKPCDERHARSILRLLSGRTHEVTSATAIRDTAIEKISVNVVTTEVVFKMLSKEAIDWYISTNEWKNRAGAYAIQGKGMALVSEVRGCLSNVIGISLPAFINSIKKFI